MFYSLTGKIVYCEQQSVAIQCGGVAFKCTVSLNTLKKIGSVGSDCTVYTYLAVREDSMELFGFADNDELELFKLLIGVSGVGPKVAISVLSSNTPAGIIFCISAGDVKTLAKAQGIGAKTAQRIVLELKDKITKIATSEISSSDFSSVNQFAASGNISEAISALSALGFSQSDAARALSGCSENLSVEELIKAGLKKLSGGF